MKVYFLGGAAEVGASCILLEIEDKKILLDCGIRQGGTKDPLPDFRTIQDKGGLDAIIISHAHLDHIGALPLISKEYPQARIYLNKMTAELMRVLLYDSLKIMGSREGELPLYAESDVEAMLKRLFLINYEAEFKLFEHIYLNLSPAGHIAGASLITLKSREGSCFYSGDFSAFSQKTVEGARIPKTRYDTAIIETTYADKLHANREVEEERLISLIEEITSQGGKVLIPSFALGRAQEIILILKKAKNKKRLPKLPVYVDGMIKDINGVYNNNPLFLKANLGRKILRHTEPFYDKTIRPVTGKIERGNLLISREPMVIIASSGMLTGGFSPVYAEQVVTGEKNGILFSGYQDEESPGHMLLDLAEKPKEERKLHLGQKVLPVVCRVEKIGLSAHGDKNEIKALIQAINPHHLFLVHGEEQRIISLAEEIAEDFKGQIYIPGGGDAYELGKGETGTIRIKKIPFRMLETETLHENNLERLWSFVLEHYTDRHLTIDELVCIWCGKRFAGYRTQARVQSLVSASVYFENDKKRLFLFRAKSKERVEEALAGNKELKQNEIVLLVQKYFALYTPKKAGYFVQEKKVLLSFDFPKALPDSIHSTLTAFQLESGWSISIHKETNTIAVETLIRQLFKTAGIRKISHYFTEGKVVLILDELYNLQNEAVRFKEVTGLSLEVQTTGQPGKEKALLYAFPDELDSHGNLRFQSSQAAEHWEQNKTFQYLEAVFISEAVKPYKCSLKNDHQGSYIELSFISPIVGKRHSSKIARLAEETGWSMTISQAFNQHAIILIAKRICEEAFFQLTKNPAFSPSTYEVTVRVKAEQRGENKPEIEALNARMIEETGCSLKFNFIL